MKLIYVLKQYEDFAMSKGANESDINDAEKKLGLLFSDEYKEYLREASVATANGHELTGISKTKAFDVIQLTEKYRHNIVDSSWYVVEDLGIDDAIIWQNHSGKIFQTIGNSEPELIANCLAEYIQR